MIHESSLIRTQQFNSYGFIMILSNILMLISHAQVRAL